MSKFRTGASSFSGTLDGVAAGTKTSGTFIANTHVTPGTLSATFVVDAETSTLTIAAGWQVSQSGTTWTDVAYAPNNPAAVVLATGTAGADAAVTKVVPAPECVAAWRFARAVVVSGGTTGTTNDTYTVSYNYLQD